jgi:VanZ family protein
MYTHGEKRRRGDGMQKKGMKRGSATWALFWWALALGWAVLLFWFSGQDGVDSSDLSGRLARALMARMPFINVSEITFEFYLRKLAHFGIFAVEGFLMRVALYNTRPSRWLNGIIAALVCCPVAVLNELYQLTAVDRSCSVTDMLIDLSGALIGIAAASLVCWICESIWVRRRYFRMVRDKKADKS